MGKKSATKRKRRTDQGSAVDLRTRRLPTSQTGEIKGGLIAETTLSAARPSKNEVAVQTLTIAHEGFIRT